MGNRINRDLAAKLAAMSTADLIRAAAPGVFAGGGYGLISGAMNPGHDEAGNRRSALAQALKRSLMGAVIGGTLTARYPEGIPATANMMRQGLDAAVGDRRGRVAAQHPADHRPDLHDAGVLPVRRFSVFCHQLRHRITRPAH